MIGGSGRMEDSERTGASAGTADDADKGRRGVSYQRPRRGGPLPQVLRPFTRTGGFYARSWGRYLGREPDELPVARPTIALATQAFFDEIVLVGLQSVRPVSSDPDAVARVKHNVIAALELYGQKGWLENPEGFFATPPPLTDVTVRPVQSRGRNYERISFESSYEPHAGVADRLVHPREQVTRLWEHWGRPEIVWYQGGHTGFFRSRSVQRFVQDALVQSGLVEASRIRRKT